MTPVVFQFLTPEGVPVKNAQVEIQLTHSSFDEQVDGILMPRLVTAITDDNGEATVALRPVPTPYIVSVYDPLSDAGLSYRFYVPELEGGNTEVRLQDVLLEGDLPKTPFEEATVQLVLTAKVNAMAAQVLAKQSQDAAKVSQDAAYASEINANAAMLVAVQSKTASGESQVAAKASEDSATVSAATATTKAAEASASAAAALVSENVTKVSESNTKTSETNAKASELAAAASKTAAATSEANAASAASLSTTNANTAVTKAGEAATSATNAATSASNALTSASNASGSATSASTSAGTATTKAGEASASATAAKTSETNAKTSETNAKSSETNAAGSATTASNAATLAVSARDTATTASTTAVTAKDNANTYANNASTSATAASNSAGAAAGSATSASTSAGTATTKASEAVSSAQLASDWAVKTTGTVNGTEYSAKKHAQDAAASASTANTKAAAANDSAAAAATSASNANTSAGTATTQAGVATTKAGDAATSAQLAADWATKATPVTAGNESAKTYAAQAAASAASAASSASAAIQGQVQSDWNQTDSAQKSFIVNKPVIPTTPAQIGLGNVENKSSATIRSEITAANINTALGGAPLVGSVATDFVSSKPRAITNLDTLTGNTDFGFADTAVGAPTGLGAFDAIGLQVDQAGQRTQLINIGSFWMHRTDDGGGWSGWAKMWDSLNDGAGSGMDADMVDGLHPDTTATGNTIMARDVNGYSSLVYLAMSHVLASRTTDTIFYSSTDNYVRKNDAAGFKTSLALNNVNNTSDANKPVSTAQQAALDLKAPLASPTFTGTVSGITKTMVGLGNVDNTSDASKPVSTAQQAALDLKAPLANPTFTGTVNGITKAMVGLPNVEDKSSATIRGELTQANVLTALNYTPPVQGNFASGAGNSVRAQDNRAVANPSTGVGYASGVRFRFGSQNDIDAAQAYADIIDLSTYTDSTGGGINSLYFNKGSQYITHKYAAAGATAWTTKTLAYTADVLMRDGSSGPMSNMLGLASSKFWESTSIAGMNANNSDIVGLNGLYFGDLCDGIGEGINFYRSATTWDTLYMNNGVLYLQFNRTNNTVGTNVEVLHANNYSNYALAKNGSVQLTGRLTGVAPSAYAAITGANQAPFEVPQVAVDPATASFVPMIHGNTILNGQGYIQHVTFGQYRPGLGATWGGAAFIGIGGADANPTEYFTLNYGGEIKHSNGNQFLHSNSGAMQPRADISTQDWNTILTAGMYRVVASSLLNGPPGYNYGTLVVVASGLSVTQIYYPHQNQAALIRTKWNAADFGAWRLAVDTSNIGSYAPTLTGAGASGTWGIAITGNAGSATKLATARNIGGVPFDGTANIQLPYAASGADGSATLLNTGLDLNTLTSTGFYRGQGLTNAPNAGWFWITHEQHDTSWATQKAVAYGSGNTANDVYVRTRAGGNWTSWERLAKATEGTSLAQLHANALSF